MIHDRPLSALRLVLICLLIFSYRAEGQEQLDTPENYNVLFIAIDDLRPELNCYGESHIQSPNIDRLAAKGLQFNRAYVQQAVCAPSRNGVMTGLRPDALGIYDLSTFFRDSVPDVITLPQYFKNNGYQAESIGKIYHRGHGNHDDSISWSQAAWFPSSSTLDAPSIERGDTVGLEGSYPTIDGKKIPYYATQVPDDNLADNRTINHALARLEALQDTTFFMAVGLVKPHLPFIAPQRYWDQYDASAIDIPHRESPVGNPDFALASFGELRKYHDIPAEGYLSDEKSRKLIHGYYAAVTYIDDLVGQLLDQLEALNLSENTIVVLWGDHGWKLGEYGNWCKHSNYELDTRIPLILRVPERTTGTQSQALVESIDIYPTLCELAGLDAPSHLQGRSLVPLLQQPNHSVKSTAWSQYPRTVDGKRIMGYAMRTNHHRYVRWQEKGNPQNVLARELYNHREDPNETMNLAVQPDYRQLVARMDSTFLAEYEIAHRSTVSNPLVRGKNR